MQVCNILRYCTLTNIARCQGNHNTKNTLTLVFILKNKRRSNMPHCLLQKTLSRDRIITYSDEKF